MKRSFSLLIATLLSVAVAGCAEQPGKKKEEDNKDGKVETKPVASAGDPNAGKPADGKAEAKSAEAK